jgi:16S rRNA (cytosine1402-N4)-methyltransferase
VNVLSVVKMPSVPPTNPSAHPHVSVLLRETIASLSPRRGQVFVDATLGAGGHTEALLRHDGTTVIGIDRDDRALHLASERLRSFGARFIPRKARFSEIADILAALDLTTVDGVIADVGVSSMQIDDPERGMSFRADGPLDMRMDPTDGESALELIARLDDDELADVIYKLGEERRSRRVARCIKQAYDHGDLKTTLDLRRAVVRAVGPARIGGVDPATRTFQALRIAVNAELEELEALLTRAQQVIKVGGIAVIISFHSLEDRLVKRAFRDRMHWTPLSKKPVIPAEDELGDNPRARSAKLRAARRTDGFAGFEPFDEETVEE